MVGAELPHAVVGLAGQQPGDNGDEQQQGCSEKDAGVVHGVDDLLLWPAARSTGGAESQRFVSVCRRLSKGLFPAFQAKSHLMLARRA